jgi:AcrR family transcriptional regulator
MTASSLSEAKAELVRQRILQGVAAVLGRREDLTFAAVSQASGVPERTCYRYFPTREALSAALFDWVNRRLGVDGERPRDAESWKSSIRRVFPGFDAVAPVIRELLISPEGRLARLAANPARQRAALAIVQREVPGLERSAARRIAAVLQLLTAAGTWQVFREYWGMDGAEAAETSVLAGELVLTGARSLATRKPRAARKKRASQGGEARP